MAAFGPVLVTTMPSPAVVNHIMYDYMIIQLLSSSRSCQPPPTRISPGTEAVWLRIAVVEVFDALQCKRSRERFQRSTQWYGETHLWILCTVKAALAAASSGEKPVEAPQRVT